MFLLSSLDYILFAFVIRAQLVSVVIRIQMVSVVFIILWLNSCVIRLPNVLLSSLDCSLFLLSLDYCLFLLSSLVDFGLNDLLRQYFSLYRAASQREGKRGEMRVKMS